MSIRRPGVILIALAALLFLLLAGQAEAGKKAGVKGVVLDSTCAGPCVEPQPQAQPHVGDVTVVVRRASDGAQVASKQTTDGHFRIRVKRGLYDVSAIPPGPPPCGPDEVCPAASPSVVPCQTGDTKRVRVRRHRFSRVELHVQNVCVL
jgi:hypothetical protein